MARRSRTYPPTVHDAAQLLGAEVREARLRRRWGVRELAERAGISTDTLHKVETGDPSVALGTAFDVAVLVGVPLFYERSRLVEEAARLRGRPVLLPRTVRARARELNNEF